MDDKGGRIRKISINTRPDPGRSIQQQAPLDPHGVGALVKKLSETQRKALVASIVEDLYHEFITEVAFDIHRVVKESSSYCQACRTKCRSFVSKEGFDIYGIAKDSNAEKYECFTCRNQYPASRFAPHLEKCMGLGRNSRVARRLTSANDRGSSPFDDDSDFIEKTAPKRKSVVKDGTKRKRSGQKLSQSRGPSDMMLDDAESVSTTPKRGSQSPTDDQYDNLFLDSGEPKDIMFDHVTF